MPPLRVCKTGRAHYPGPREIGPFLGVRIGVSQRVARSMGLPVVETFLLHQRHEFGAKARLAVASCTTTQRPVFFTGCDGLQMAAAR